MTHSSGRSLSVRVALADSFAAQAHPEQVVFVFARAADGPPMPIAVQRIQVKDLPAVVTLDETMGMTPALSLAAFSNVIVGARVSSSGLAPPQSGDLEGEYGPIDVDTSASLAVTIDRVRP